MTVVTLLCPPLSRSFASASFSNVVCAKALAIVANQLNYSSPFVTF